MSCGVCTLWGNASCFCSLRSAQQSPWRAETLAGLPAATGSSCETVSLLRCSLADCLSDALCCSGMFEDNTFMYMIEPLELVHDEVGL